jgi:hypothetical protein
MDAEEGDEWDTKSIALVAGAVILLIALLIIFMQSQKK